MHAVLPRPGCKIYVLDLSEMASVLGYPPCDPARFVTDPEFGTILPNASMLLPKFNLTPPMQQYESMYPFYAKPHYESLNAGARCSGSATSTHGMTLFLIRYMPGSADCCMHLEKALSSLPAPAPNPPLAAMNDSTNCLTVTCGLLLGTLSGSVPAEAHEMTIATKGAG